MRLSFWRVISKMSCLASHLRRVSYCSSCYRNSKLNLSKDRRSLPQKYPRNRCADQVGHGSRKHGTHTQSGKVIAALGNQRANAADLHADRTEVCESAQCECGNDE